MSQLILISPIRHVFLHIFSFRSMEAVAMYTMGLTIATARGGGRGRGRVIMFSCSSQRSGFYHACTFDSGFFPFLVILEDLNKNSLV